MMFELDEKKQEKFKSEILKEKKNLLKEMNSTRNVDLKKRGRLILEMDKLKKELGLN